MATNPTTDLTEEDAADLQFPKEYDRILNSSDGNDSCSSDSNNSFSVKDVEQSLQTCNVCLNIIRLCVCYKCANCQTSLQVPFIECSQCENVNICCRCFACGSEFGCHKSDHNYRVLKHDFILFDQSNWTAAEELILLDTLYTYGYGNWELVSKKLPNRSEREVKQHYDRFYIDRPTTHLLPKVPETIQSLFPQPVIPFRYRLIDIEEPPRYAPQTIGYQSVSGYNPARSDFELEYDANAEQLLANLNEKDFDITHPHYDTIIELQCAIVRSYNRRLKERQRRKNIVKEHGLILMRKTMSWMHRYDRTLTRTVTERMLCFMQYLSGTEFDFMMEGLHRAVELRQRISQLCEYRRKGLKTLQAAEIYDHLKQERERHKKELSSFLAHPLFNWKNLTNSFQVVATHVPNKRGQFRPLDIVGLPGYEKLSRKEQEMCSSVRLVPQTYLELKDVLMTENKKLGYLKLQTARKMLKIDVNKTRKLYDFLISEGYISKPTS